MVGAQVAVVDQRCDPRITDHLIKTQFDPVGAIRRCGKPKSPSWPNLAVQVGHAGGGVMLRFVHNQQIHHRRILFKHADWVHSHTKATSEVFRFGLRQQIASHRDPSNACSGRSLQ